MSNNLNPVVSDCCLIPIEFYSLERKGNRTYALYRCPKCWGLYERG